MAVHNLGTHEKAAAEKRRMPRVNVVSRIINLWNRPVDYLELQIVHPLGRAFLFLNLADEQVESGRAVIRLFVFFSILIARHYTQGNRRRAFHEVNRYHG